MPLDHWRHDLLQPLECRLNLHDEATVANPESRCRLYILAGETSCLPEHQADIKKAVRFRLP